MQLSPGETLDASTHEKGICNEHHWDLVMRNACETEVWQNALMGDENVSSP